MSTESCENIQTGFIGILLPELSRSMDHGFFQLSNCYQGTYRFDYFQFGTCNATKTFFLLPNVYANNFYHNWMLLSLFLLMIFVYAAVVAVHSRFIHGTDRGKVQRWHSDCLAVAKRCYNGRVFFMNLEDATQNFLNHWVSVGSCV